MFRFKTMPMAIAMGVALLVATACSDEQPASPAPPAQDASRSPLEISAGLVPQLDEAVLRNMADFCSEYAPRTRATVEAAWTQWQARNGALLTVARHYHARLEDSAANGIGEDERRANQELLAQHETLIESFTNQELDVMRVALDHDEPKVVAQICTEHFEKVAAGEWDIRRRDPEIAALLDAGVPKSLPSTPTPTDSRPR